ncbi:MAG TPA: multicopper oxidase domain-containing protein [Candidatus Binataceae bacterium]|nr:multicopper oxidase domain-containing protein [Candidatus Binataceae bacterium]
MSAPCTRYAAGSTAVNPPAFYSSDGVLSVDLAYNTEQDAEGRTLYCFTTPDGTESPTLHIRPGDHLVVNVKNNLPAPTSASAMRMSTNADTVCGATTMDSSSVNIHYHGTNTSPTCHQDEVIHTLINSGETFTYNVAFPRNEPPGLYWYHPHVHGQSESAVQGGASGAIIIDGVENVQPAVQGLPQRVLMIRDQIVPGEPPPMGRVPSWDLTLNYVPISYPAEVPAVIEMKPQAKEFWRVANASADTILDLQVLYNEMPQVLQLVAVDGVPVGSQDGTGRGTLIPVTDFRLPPASRVEFILTGPARYVKSAKFLTQAVDTGPDGDNDPRRTLANIVVTNKPVIAAQPAIQESSVQQPSTPAHQRFKGLANARVTARRKLYFSENNPDSQFFITVAGQKPTLFSPDNPPAITTTQGSVEEWTIENRTLENHEFHLHQVHFMVMSQNNFQLNGSQPVQAIQGQLVDMIEVPFWDGNPAHAYPNVAVRVDFRGPDTGDFVYHCHILEHEDGGMMAIIRVLPKNSAVAQFRDSRENPHGFIERLLSALAPLSNPFTSAPAVPSSPRLPQIGLCSTRRADN